MAEAEGTIDGGGGGASQALGNVSLDAAIAYVNDFAANAAMVEQVSQTISNNGQVTIRIGATATGDKVSVPISLNPELTSITHTHPVGDVPIPSLPSDGDYNALEEANFINPEVPNSIVAVGENLVVHFWIDENDNSFFSREVLNFRFRRRNNG